MQQVTAFEEAYMKHIRTSHQELLKNIREQGQLTDELDKQLAGIVKDFMASFTA